MICYDIMSISSDLVKQPESFDIPVAMHLNSKCRVQMPGCRVASFAAAQNI